MVDITREEYWDEKDSDKPKTKFKTTFENRMIMIGLILFGLCIAINSVLIYTFFRILTKL